MFRFSSNIDPISFQKIKSGNKKIKFYLRDTKHAKLSVGDTFSISNNHHEKLSVLAKSIKISKNLRSLIKKFPLQELGETRYSAAYTNIKQWFSERDIKYYSIMAVSMEIIYE